jgi:uncharacterized protein YaeQ
MRIRCDLQINGEARKLILVPGLNEPLEHQALKLAAYLLFWSEEPAVDISPKTPALADYDFLPDLLALDDTGAIKLWVECGSTTRNKLTKLTRRLSRSRIVVMKETERDAQGLREELRAQLVREARVEILAWPGRLFRDWVEALRDHTEIFGDSGGLLLNVVVNEHPFAAELQRF